jgi:hypothetical protein
MTNMCAAVLSNNEPVLNSNDNHLEIFSLIWLDANNNIKDNRDAEQELRTIINHFKEFQDVKECQKYIEQKSKQDRLIFVVNDQLGQEIVPSVHKLRQVLSIYVYCKDEKTNGQWISNFPKVNL